MKSAAVTSTYRVSFETPRPAPKPEKAVSQVPRAVRLLALAHRVDELVQSRELRDYAHAAEVLGLTRARVSQIMNLTLLAPEIQDAILALPSGTNGRQQVTERVLRRIVSEPDWTRQIEMWNEGET